jgi:hypothetical protein
VAPVRTMVPSTSSVSRGTLPGQRVEHQLLIEPGQRSQRLLPEAPQPVAHGARCRRARQAREAAHQWITHQLLQVLQPPGRQRQEQQGEARAALVPAERRVFGRALSYFGLGLIVLARGVVFRLALCPPDEGSIHQLHDRE